MWWWLGDVGRRRVGVARPVAMLALRRLGVAVVVLQRGGVCVVE